MNEVGEKKYWEEVDYDSANLFVRSNLATGQRAAIAIGYYLKRIRDERLYLDGGYANFAEYVRAECGFSESTASRHIARMEQFSEGGNSPKLAARYAEYSASQLQEMLYLTDEQREQASPDMTVKEIRAIRKDDSVETDNLMCEHNDSGICVVLSDAETEQPCIEGPCSYEETCDAASEGVAETMVELPGNEPCDSCAFACLPEYQKTCQSCAGSGSSYVARCITGQSCSGQCGAAAYCNRPYTCCAQCDEDCNVRCGWIPWTERAETVAVDIELPGAEEVATPQEPEEKKVDDVPDFDPWEVRQRLWSRESDLDAYLEVQQSDGGIPEITIRQIQMDVAGLRLLLKAVEEGQNDVDAEG